MKNILYLQMAIDPPAPRNIRTLNIVKYLQQSFSIEIITFESYSNPIAIENVLINRLKFGFISKYILNKEISGVKLNRITLFISRAISFIMQNFLLPDVWKFEHKKILNHFNKSKKQYDFIICSIVPFSTGELGIKLKKKYFPNAKLILDIGDPLTNNSANIKTKTADEQFEKNLLKNADLIVVTNPETSKYYISKYQIEIENIKIISQGFESNSNQINNYFKVNYDKIKLMYAGSFYQNFRSPLELFAALKKFDNEDFSFKIFSNNCPNLELLNSDLKIQSRIEYNSLQHEYKNSNLLLYIDNSYGIQTSGKIYELLSLKIPILFIYDNDQSRIKIECESYTHIFFVKNKSSDIIEALSNIQNSNIEFENYSIEKFSWNFKAKEFKNYLDNL